MSRKGEFPKDRVGDGYNIWAKDVSGVHSVKVGVVGCANVIGHAPHALCVFPFAPHVRLVNI
jgi:hypothetical protein